MIVHEADGSVTMTDPNEPQRVQVIPAGTSSDQIGRQAHAFFHPSPLKRALGWLKDPFATLTGG